LEEKRIEIERLYCKVDQRRIFIWAGYFARLARSGLSVDLGRVSSFEGNKEFDDPS